MKRPKYTPGTWKYADWASDSDNNVCIAEMGLESMSYDGAIVTDEYQDDGISDEQMLANAKLMVAAPKMFEALDYIYDQLGIRLAEKDEITTFEKTIIDALKAAGMTDFPNGQ